MNAPEPIDHEADAELRAARARPDDEFGSRLRDRLMEADARARRPARLRLLIAAYACSGLLLLALAALSASGGGVFGS
jgi:hypothetical protein